jgi:hypothetical protein
MNKLLNELFELKAKLTPCYPSGAFITKTPVEWSDDPVRLREWWTEGYRLFRHVPYKTGFFCFDLDRHESKPDGIIGWYELLLKAYQQRVPACLQNLNAYPCFVVTPSGGAHLYFRQTIPVTCYKHRLPGGVEIKYTDWINCGYKNNKEYALHGTLTKAIELPDVVLAYLQEPPILTYDPCQKRHKKLNKTVSELLQTARNNNKYGNSRHDIILHIAYIGKHNGIDRQTIIDFIRADSYLAGNVQIDSTVNSVY